MPFEPFDNAQRGIRDPDNIFVAKTKGTVHDIALDHFGADKERGGLLYKEGIGLAWRFAICQPSREFHYKIAIPAAMRRTHVNTSGKPAIRDSASPLTGAARYLTSGKRHSFSDLTMNG
jgi:hypothetical protein